MENMEEVKLDNTIELQKVEVSKAEPKTRKKLPNPEGDKENALVNCLRNETVTVKYIAKKEGIWGDNPRHVLAGGMAESAKKVMVVPVLSSGQYVNVLTNAEKKFLEEFMGLEPNALSVHKKVNNFWDSDNEDGINRVTLTKQDTYLNLSIPEDYIKYKILLANKTKVAASYKVLQDTPLATFEYVIISQGDEQNRARLKTNARIEAYKNLGKIESDRDKLILILETMQNGKPVSNNTKIEFIQSKVEELIQNNAKLFNNIVNDQFLDAKVLLRKATLEGFVAKRGNYYYLKDGSNATPLCDINQDPTFTNAAMYISSPKHNDLYMLLQAKVGE